MFLYHVTRRDFRKSILEHGLNGKDFPSVWEHIRKGKTWNKNLKTQPRGNYGFQFISDALDYRAGMTVNRSSSDIWQINTEGFDVKFDPEAFLASPLTWEEFEDAVGKGNIEECCQELCCHYITARRWYIEEVIPPNRITLLEQVDIKNILSKEELGGVCEIRERVFPLPVWKEIKSIQMV